MKGQIVVIRPGAGGEAGVKAPAGPLHAEHADLADTAQRLQPLFRMPVRFSCLAELGGAKPRSSSSSDNEPWIHRDSPTSLIEPQQGLRPYQHVVHFMHASAVLTLPLSMAAGRLLQ